MIDLEQFRRLVKHCYRCNDEIIFLRNEKTGKTTAVNADLGWGGNVEIDLEAGTYRIVKIEGRHKAYRLHVVTCKARRGSQR